MHIKYYSYRFLKKSLMLVMTHLLEIIQVKKLKENCGKGILMQEFRNGEEGLILKYCFAWTNVLAGVILCYG